MPIRVEDFRKIIVSRNFNTFLSTRTQNSKFHSYTAEKEGSTFVYRGLVFSTGHIVFCLLFYLVDIAFAIVEQNVG